MSWCNLRALEGSEVSEVSEVSSMGLCILCGVQMGMIRLQARTHGRVSGQSSSIHGTQHKF